MEVLYEIASDIKYRREAFGAAVLIGHSKETRFFNHAAAVVIEQFSRASTLADAERGANRVLGEVHDHRPLLELLRQTKIIAKSSGAEGSAQMFFTENFDFADDRLHAPLGVELELTLKCMRRCTYCAYDSSPSVDTESEFDRTTLSELLHSLDQLGVFYVRFTGGDPLTRPDAMDILEDADQLGFGIAVASDLSVLTDEHVFRLSQLKNLTALQTTLDGPTLDVADEFRGTGNFRRTTEGIARLREARVPIIVGTVLTTRNHRSVYETARLLSQWDVSYCVSPLYDAGRANAQQPLIPSDDELTIAYEQFAAAIDDGLVRAADPGWHVIAEAVPRDARHALWAGQPWLVRSPDRLMRIDPTGRCYTSIHLKNILGDNVYVGRWPSDGLLEMWQSAPLLQELRRSRRRSSYYGDVIDIRQLTRHGKELSHDRQ